MSSQRSILSLRYTPVSVIGGVRKAVGGFLRYVQYRDQHADQEPSKALDAYVRYVAHRDRSAPAGRVFGPGGKRTDVDRRELIDYVTRSTQGLQPRWVMGRDGTMEDRQRAVYTLVLSPEDWRGLELRELAKTAMAQLELDAGPGGIGPWIAAEHRNTRHHHVHIVLAARREVAPGRFSTLVINRVRLQRMKDAIAHEIQRQRPEREPTRVVREAARLKERIPLVRHPAPRWRLLPEPAAQRRRAPAIAAPRREIHHSRSWLRMQAVAASYRRRMERELEEQSLRAEREGWTR